jgi:hypothetical protein
MSFRGAAEESRFRTAEKTRCFALLGMTSMLLDG